VDGVGIGIFAAAARADTQVGPYRSAAVVRVGGVSEVETDKDIPIGTGAAHLIAR
jgi:hypothetical protein